ncbi:hypothetical protein V7056_12925 [Bacillus sp. JJ664]
MKEIKIEIMIETEEEIEILRLMQKSRLIKMTSVVQLIVATMTDAIFSVVVLVTEVIG